MSNQLTFRRAVEADAHGIAEVARRVSAKQYILDFLDEKGVTHSLSDAGVDTIKKALPDLISDEDREVLDQQLSESGFLLYPLDADNPNVPNYKERIGLADHFWVATEEDGTVRAFMMAYTLGQMNKITQQTGNDKSVLGYFLFGEDASPEDQDLVRDETNVYIQAVATDPEVQSSGVMSQLVNEALSEENRGDAPRAIAEVAQVPHRNVASSEFFLRNGYGMDSTRLKDNGARVSGTFVKTFPVFDQ